MKRLLLVGLSALFCLSALPLYAQDSQSSARRGSSSGSASSPGSEPAWFNTTIDIDFKNQSMIDAIKKILDAAKVKYDRVEATFELPKTKFSLTAKDVNTRDALGGMARLIGALTYVVTEDGKTVIELRKRTNDVSIALPMAPFGGLTVRSDAMTLPARIQNYKDLPQVTVNADVKDGFAEDLLKQIAEQAHIDWTIEPDIQKEKNKVAVTITQMSLGAAIDFVARMLECGWTTEKTGDRVKVTFSKKFGTPERGRIIQGLAQPGPMVQLPPFAGSTRVTIPERLPSKKVSLDTRKADPREALKDVLKQAGLSYAIGDDLPSEPKSFTFSDVSITTALDMICESIGASWSVERNPDGKPLVRIGKGRGRTRSSQNTLFAPFLGLNTLRNITPRQNEISIA